MEQHAVYQATQICTDTISKLRRRPKNDVLLYECIAIIAGMQSKTTVESSDHKVSLQSQTFHLSRGGRDGVQTI